MLITWLYQWSWLIIVIIISIIMGIVIVIIIVISLVRPELTASPLRGLIARPAPSQARVRCAVSELGAVRAVRSLENGRTMLGQW